MGGNACKELGIAPNVNIGSKDFLQLWRTYDVGNKAFLTYKESRKLLKDFADAVKMSKKGCEFLVDFLLIDYLNSRAELLFENFQLMFLQAVKVEDSVSLTKSLVLTIKPQIVDKAEMWRIEEKLTVEQRRKRYKCGERYVIPEVIPRWLEYCAKKQLQTNLAESLKLEEQHRQKVAQQKSEVEEKKPSPQAQVVTEKVEKKGEKEKVGTKESRRSERRKQLESALGINHEDFVRQKDYAPDDDKEVDVIAIFRKSSLMLEKSMEEPQMSLDNLPSEPVYDINDNINDKIALYRGDITTLELDAIVNAANKRCMGGGGIDGAIHSAASNSLQKECSTLHGCKTGEAKITKGYNLPAKHVIHTAGPMVFGIGVSKLTEQQLESCYRNSLEVAVANGIKTLALCGISTGIYGYPLRLAARTALNTVRKWLETDSNWQKVDLIVFCSFLPKEEKIYDRYAPLYFPIPS